MIASSWSRLLGPVAAGVLAILMISPPAIAADRFCAGDEIVLSQAARLMRGPNTLATLSQGQHLKVLATEGDWVGTSVVVNGQNVGGWVHNRQVTTPSQYAQRQTTRRRYSYQPGPAIGGYADPRRSYSRSSNSGGKFIMGVAPYGPAYWRADRKIVGY